MRRWVAASAIATSLAVAAPAGAGDVPALPPDTDADYQLGGNWDAVPEHVGIIVRDRKAEPLEGRFNICYVNGFQTQPDEHRFWRGHHWRLILKKDGRPVVDEVWSEWLFDIRTRSKRRELAGIVGRWTERCADDGFDAVEYDNLDSFTRSKGILERRHALAYAKLLIGRADGAGLPVGQKNFAEFDGTTIGFDFVVAEECGKWDECDLYEASFGDQVIVIEYRRRDFTETCATYADQWPIMLRNLALTPGGVHRYC